MRSLLNERYFLLRLQETCRPLVFTLLREHSLMFLIARFQVFCRVIYPRAGTMEPA